MNKKDQEAIIESYYKRIVEGFDDKYDEELPESAIAVDVYTRREDEATLRHIKQDIYKNIEGALARAGYPVELHNDTINNGASVLELTVYADVDWGSGVDYDTREIESIVSQHNDGYNFDVYMAGTPE